MNKGTHVDASYTPTGVRRFDGNPFIEALPILESTKSEFLTSLSNYPPAPTTATRRQGEIVRTMELGIIDEVVMPFPEYQKSGLAGATILREAYVARHPLSVIDVQRRHALAAQGADGVMFPANWKSTAKGYFVMAHSGMGKTTFMNAFLLRYPQVITHNDYQGQHLRCQQVVYLVLRMPHDATLKSLCLQFFEEIDRLLGTSYLRQARSAGSIAEMARQMNQVATAVSLGFLIVDELQNLRAARGEKGEVVLNLFSEVIERLGISLMVLATPAVQSVLEGNVRNTRKLASYGETVIQPMRKGDAQWNAFCDTMWDYTFVKNKGRLENSVRDAWFAASAGNTAFACLAFMLAQRNEIGRREVVDAEAFQRTAATDMAFLQPAIMALRSKNPNALQAFDDLILSPRYKALRKMLGVEDTTPKKSTSDEFEEVSGQPKHHAHRSKVAASNKKSDQHEESWPDLPLEDPLVV
ncbi:ATP-binding protein [Variovorax sp. HJSM1_2]|uniref:ATP-binding protein n=1 Tax=Variovorax sp. HJSM1_2 TaxID=3366263 RepID=UPI003BD3D142